MKFRQLFDKESSTYTYLLGDEKTTEAILIDPVLTNLDRDCRLLKELGLTLKFALDTHVHADHISALGSLRERTGCRTVMSAKNGAKCADLRVVEGDKIRCGAITVEVIETPGHTAGCLTYRVGEKIFTGDALLIRGCGRTDFQEGDPGKLYDSVVRKLFKLEDDVEVYPAHDYSGFTRSTIGEEKEHNPRLTKTKPEFVAFMKALKLPDPKMILTAVPANLACGKK